MSQGPTPWNVLSTAIRNKVESSRAKHDAAEAQERQNEFDIIMEGVRAHAANGTLTDDMITQAQAKMQKLVPKETHPLIDAFTKVLGHVRDARRKKQQQGPGQGKPGGQGQSPGSGSQPSPGPSQPGTPVPPGTSGGGSPAPQTANAPIPALTPAGKPVGPGMYPSASEIGTAQATMQTAQDSALTQSRTAAVDALRKKYEGKGDNGESGLNKEELKYLDIWATTGHLPPGALIHSKRHPVTIEDPAGGPGLVPAMVDEDGIVYANGAEVQNPRIMPKWKPRVGWAKLGPGKFVSFNIDPQTNQPIPGTESSANLPPNAYLDKLREGVYHYTDDAGNVHESPFTVRSFANVPTNMPAPGGTPAVPPAFKALPKPKSKTGSTGTGTGTSTPKAKKSDIIGTKDAGILSPAGQKVLMTTEPVVNQARKLEKIFDDNPDLKTNDTPGYLLLPYILYRLGYASDGPLQEEIAGLSLGSVIEAASVLQGTSRSISALRLAMVHTPNAKVDSPAQIYRKLHNDIIPRLDDVMDAAKKYGRKRSSVAVPPGMDAPPSSIDKQAEEYLRQ